MLSRENRPKVATEAAGLADDPTFREAYPTLWDHLTQDRWEDGTARQTSSMLLFRDGGVFKVMFRDKDAGACLWIAVQSPLNAFDALEAALCDPRADWRADRQQPGQQAKRIKRPGA